MEKLILKVEIPQELYNQLQIDPVQVIKEVEVVKEVEVIKEVIVEKPIYIKVPMEPWEIKAEQIIEEGKKYIGTPYVFGASSYRTDIFDCSSFVQRIYYENGITLPRNSRQQSLKGESVEVDNLRDGDLIFFANTNRTDGLIDHVAVFLKIDGEKHLLHTIPNQGVIISKVNNYWISKFEFAKRVI